MKISFIGAGGVGCSTAFICGLNNIFDEIVMIDLNEEYASGKAIDLQQGFILNGKKNVNVIGTNNYDNVEGSDCIVITAGFPSHGAVSREELLAKNKQIIEEVAQKITNIIPHDDKQPLIIMVTNPLDVILKHFIEIGNFNKKRTIGSGNFLDTGRFKYYLGEELKVDCDKIETYAMGQHGQKIVYLLSQTKIDGTPLEEYMRQNNISKETIEEIKKKATAGASTIIKMIVKGGTFYGPAVSINYLIDSVFNDRKNIVTVSTWCNGEYNVKDACFGCPVILGKNGVEKIEILNLSEEEHKLLKESFEFINSFN